MLRAALAALADPLTAEWLLREMSENREKSAASEKRYSAASIYKDASSGQLPSPSKRGCECHNFYGAPSLLHQYKQHPSLLGPQGLA